MLFRFELTGLHLDLRRHRAGSSCTAAGRQVTIKRLVRLTDSLWAGRTLTYTATCEYFDPAANRQVWRAITRQRSRRIAFRLTDPLNLRQITRVGLYVDLPSIPSADLAISKTDNQASPHSPGAPPVGLPFIRGRGKTLRTPPGWLLMRVVSDYVPGISPETAATTSVASGGWRPAITRRRRRLSTIRLELCRVGSMRDRRCHLLIVDAGPPWAPLMRAILAERVQFQRRRQDPTPGN